MEEKRSLQSWGALNPSWSHQFCSGEDIADFFHSFHPGEVARLFDRLPPGELKTDLWRYAVLHEFGGVYTETGSICRASLDEWLATEGGKGLHVACENDAPLFCHRTIIAARGHPVLARAIDLILERAVRPAAVNETDTDRKAGATLWTKAIRRYLGREEEPMTLYHQRFSFADKDIEIHPCYFFDGVKVRQRAAQGSQAISHRHQAPSSAPGR